jgi:hypothetical protein
MKKPQIDNPKSVQVCSCTSNGINSDKWDVVIYLIRHEQVYRWIPTNEGASDSRTNLTLSLGYSLN